MAKRVDRVPLSSEDKPVRTYRMKALCSNCKQSGIYDILCGRTATTALHSTECQTCGCRQVLINPEPVPQEMPSEQEEQAIMQSKRGPKPWRA